jgi:hypothetical protein
MRAEDAFADYSSEGLVRRDAIGRDPVEKPPRN